MKKSMVKQLLEKLKSTGFFHVFTSQVIVKIVSFCGAMLIVRVLSKDDYGLYSYASNILSMFLLLDGIGTASAALQYSSENYSNTNKKNSFLKYGFTIGFTFNIVVAFVIYIVTMFYTFEIVDAKSILILMALQPLFSYIMSTIQVYLRAEVRNKEYSWFNTIQSVLTIIATIAGAYIGGVKGVVIFKYVAYFIIIVYGIVISKDFLEIFKFPIIIDRYEKKEFMSYAVVTAFNNAISSLLYTIDIFVIGIFFPDTSTIASYKTATLIPFALNFIPTAIVIYIYPYFARNNKNKAWIKEKYVLLLKYLGMFNLIISIVLFCFAPLIIQLIFGSQYLDAVIPFRILAIGYFVNGTFRTPGGNIIAMMHKIKFNMYVAVGSGIMNILLNVPFIMYFGPVGASLATLIIFIITAIANTLYIEKLLR